MRALRPVLLVWCASLGLASAAVSTPPTTTPLRAPTPRPTVTPTPNATPRTGTPAPQQEAGHTVHTLKRASGPYYLLVPERCAAGAAGSEDCALVIVSHPRAQDTDRLRRSPGVSTLTGGLLRGGFAVLLSQDGGPTTWGSPAALAEVAGVRQEAGGLFAWNRRTYALGLSMGGLAALRSALPGSPYPVSGVALIDAWVDLRAAWASALSRRAEINAAYGAASVPPAHQNPLAVALNHPPLPLFIAASLDDEVVDARSNGDLLGTHAQPGTSVFVPLTGPHLGGNRFTPEMSEQLTDFYRRLETQVQARKP
ncbi:alpha/beta hydrolase [Deinococcus taklimakanensis]|uniref:Alpha/beta hydrolase n=1 Tax=Deinococcus taklimakanensis TaxID=536443 RepID=A0ABW5NZD3_9DEIO